MAGGTTYPVETEAFMWYCGDEVCECSQPVVEQYTYRSDYLGRRKLIDRKRLWEGTFRAGADAGESEAQRRELVAECERRGLPVPEVVRRLMVDG